MTSTGVRKVVAAYGLFSALYIVFSDRLLFAVFPSVENAARVSTWKGLAFVVLTSALLAFVLERARRVERDRYRALFEDHDAVMLTVDPAGGAILDANPAAVAFYGWDRHGLRGRRLADLEVGPEGRAPAPPPTPGSDTALHSVHRRADGTTRDVEVRSATVKWGRQERLFCIIHDETDRRRTERALARMQRLYDLLSETNGLIVRAKGRGELFQRIAEIAVERGGFLFAWVGSMGDGGGVTPVARAGDDHGYIDALRLSIEPGRPGAQGPTAVALREGRHVVVNDFLTAHRTAPWHEAAQKAGIAASAAFPLRFQGQPVASLNLYAGEVGFFGPDELTTLDEMASDLSFALDTLHHEEERTAALESLRVASQVVESSPVVLFRWRASEGWPVEYVSSNVAQWGYTAEEFRAGTIRYDRMIHPDDLSRVEREVAANVASRAGAFTQEYRIVSRDGVTVHVVDRTVVVYDKSGEPTHFQGLVSDETARIEAESARRQSEKLLSMALDRSPIVLSRQDRDLRYTWIRFDAMGAGASSGLGKTDAELLPADEAEEMTRRKRAVLETGEPWRGELKLTLPDGTHHYETSIEPVRAADGSVEGVWATSMDVSERRRLDDERRASEVRYRAMFEANPHAMWLADRATGELLSVNDAALSQYGYTREEMLALRAEDLRATQLPGHGPGSLVPALPSERASARLEQHRRKDGSTIEVEVSAQRFRFDDRDAEVVLALDVTAAVRAQRALNDEKERFRALTEQSFVGVFVVDAANVVYANPRCEEIFGTSGRSPAGRPFAEVVVPADLPRVAASLEALLSGEVATVREEFRGVRADGREIVIGAQARKSLTDGRPVVLGVLQDITEKSRADGLVAEYVGKLERAVLGTVGAVSQMVELRDPYTAGHERRVGELASAIAREMGLDEDVQRGLIIAGAVHDAGKIAIPAEILTKPGRLTRIEYDMVKGHAEQGYEVLKNIDFPWPVALVARQHHERIDGSGYPLGLKGTEILLEARIVAVADVVESMASHRPYRPTRGLGVALDEIKQNAGKLYDADVAAACLRLFWERGYTLPE